MGVLHGDCGREARRVGGALYICGIAGAPLQARCAWAVVRRGHFCMVGPAEQSRRRAGPDRPIWRPESPVLFPDVAGAWAWGQRMGGAPAFRDSGYALYTCHLPAWTRIGTSTSGVSGCSA